MATGEYHLWRRKRPLSDRIKASSPVLLRRSNSGSTQIHHQNRLKQLNLEKNDSPISPSTRLTSQNFKYLRPFGNQAVFFSLESQFLQLTILANQSMTPGCFEHEVDDSRAVVADFYK